MQLKIYSTYLLIQQEKAQYFKSQCKVITGNKKSIVAVEQIVFKNHSFEKRWLVEL